MRGRGRPGRRHGPGLRVDHLRLGGRLDVLGDLVGGRIVDDNLGSTGSSHSALDRLGFWVDDPDLGTVVVVHIDQAVGWVIDDIVARPGGRDFLDFLQRGAVDDRYMLTTAGREVLVLGGVDCDAVD